MQIYWSLLCCTILQTAYYVDILIITFLHNIVGSVLGRYLGHYFTAQYCRQRTMQISWSLLCCTILQAAYYVDILVITLLHNIVGSVLCRYLGHYFAAQYCRQRTRQISWSLLYCTILQAAYYVDILVITLLHNTVGSVLCRYLAAQYCSYYVAWSLFCNILQAAYYVDILVVTLLHNTVGSVLCRYLGHYLCCTILQAAYYVDILVITLLHNIVGSVLCRYLGHYFAAQYCRQRTMQISWSLLCCTILQAAYYVDILVVTLLHNIVGSILYRYLGHYLLHNTVDLLCRFLVITLLHNTVGSVLCRYLGHYFAAQYCRQRTMQISWSLLCCTILQAAYYVDILVVTLLHNIVGSVLCRYLGHYFVAQYCRQRTMQISWSLLCCTILQTEFHLDILVITLLHNTVGSVLCRYLGHYFAAQYCRQCTMQISWSLLCRTILQAAYYVDILVVNLLYNTVGRILCRYLGHYFAFTILQAVYYVDILVVILLHNIVGSVLCRYLVHYFTAQYCLQCTMQISWSLLCRTILQAAYYVDILVVNLLYNTVGRVLCRYLGHYFAAQ